MENYKEVKNIKSIMENNQYINLIRIRDKNGNYFPKIYNFLSNYYGCDILGFKNNYLTIIFVRKNYQIINYVICETMKQFTSDLITFTLFKKIILNENYKKLPDILLYSKNNLFNYEIDLLNDINDWLNDYVSSYKIYYLMYNL